MASVGSKRVLNSTVHTSLQRAQSPKRSLSDALSPLRAEPCRAIRRAGADKPAFTTQRHFSTSLFSPTVMDLGCDWA